MSIRTAVVFILSILGVFFLAVNWAGIVAPVPVNLLYTQVEAPLGLIVLLLLGVLWIAWILWSLMQQASFLVDIRRAYKEAQTNKNLAENAELSRTERLTKQLTASFEALEKNNANHLDAVNLSQSHQLEDVLSEIRLLKEELAYTKETVKALAVKAEVPLPEKDKPKEETLFSRLTSRKKAKTVQQTK